MSGLAGCVMDPRLGLSPDCAAVILAAGDGVRPCAGSRRKTENDRGRVAGQTGEAGTWFKTPWHYPCIGYRGHLLGLFVETDDENVARREAEDVCSSVLH
jgi:hypothetical protein